MASVSVPAQIAEQIPGGYVETFSRHLVALLVEGFTNLAGSWPYHPGRCRFVRAPICLTYDYELEPYCYVVWLFILAAYRKSKPPEMTTAQIAAGTALSLRHTRRALAHLIKSKLLTRTRVEEPDVCRWEAMWKDEWIWCPVAASIFARPMPVKAKVALIRFMPLVISNTPRVVSLYTHELAQVTGYSSVRRAYEFRKLMREHGFIRTGPVQKSRGIRTEHEIDLLGEDIFASRFIKPRTTDQAFDYVGLGGDAANRLQITKVGRLL